MVFGGADSMGFSRWEWLVSMPETNCPASDGSDPSDLISCLKAIADVRFLRGLRYTQWFFLLVALLEILSGCRSSLDIRADSKS